MQEKLIPALRWNITYLSSLESTILLSYSLFNITAFTNIRDVNKKAIIKSMITAFFNAFKRLLVTYKRAVKSLLPSLIVPNT